MCRTSTAASLFALLLLAGPTRADDGVFEDARLGVRFSVPEGDWKRTEGESGSSRYVLFERRGAERSRIALQFWPQEGDERSLDDWCDQELSFDRTTQRVEEIVREPRTVGSESARATRYRTGAGDDRASVDATYLRHRGSVFRVSVSAPAAQEGELPALVAAALDGLEWIAIEAEASPPPLELLEPIPGNVLTVVHAGGVDAPYRYLEALPGAAATNGGLPIVLLVDGQLSSMARTFLRQYRPSEIHLDGEPLSELPSATQVERAWGVGGPVVVTARTLTDAVPAAALATRWGVPLLVSGAALADRLARQAPSKIWVAGSVELPDGIEGIRLGDAHDIAGHAGGEYVALCNPGSGAGREIAVFAAALAAAHAGVVLPLDEPVGRLRAKLKPTESVPPGMADSGADRFVVGALRVEGVRRLVAAPVTGELRISGVTSDRFGRPRFDVNGDGRLSADEELKVGSTVQVQGKPFALTVRYQTALGHPGLGEAILQAPDPAEIRKSIRDFARRQKGLTHLAIVGTPDQIPFALLESDSYFTSLDIKQEIASDAPYANLDQDPSLELAVGRVLTADLINGSAVVATTLAYPRCSGPWRERASVLAPGFEKSESRGALHWVWPESEALARSVVAELASAGIETDAFLRDDVELSSVFDSMRQAGWIGHMNHANQVAWGIRPGAHIGTADIPPLEGAPIVFGTGCTSAGIDLGTPLSQTWPGRFFERGAVAYLGNTRPASLGSEIAVQRLFAKLMSEDGVSLGEAYRDGRNLLAHLLEQGHFDPELGARGFDSGMYERLWMQFYNLNLFGDPALTPHLPEAPPTAVQVSFEPNGDRGYRLTINRHSDERIDPLLIMAASGQGTAREAQLLTANGLTYGFVPHFYLEQGELSPLRQPLSVPPGAWVDVALPPEGERLELELVEGAPWVERGFVVEEDPDGTTRLRMFVPLAFAPLESGAGELLSRVTYDVRFSGPTGRPVPSRVPGTFVAATPERVHATDGRVTEEARPILDRLRRRTFVPESLGLTSFQVSVANPGAGILGQSSARLSWSVGSSPTVAVRDLPEPLQSHHTHVERAYVFLFDLIRNDPSGLLAPGRYDVEKTMEKNGATVLLLRPPGDSEADEEIWLAVSSQGRLERMSRVRFGVEVVTRFDWRETPEGDVLSRMTTDDFVYGQPQLIELDYGEGVEGLPMPVRVRSSVPGIFAHSFVFDLRYDHVTRARR